MAMKNLPLKNKKTITFVTPTYNEEEGIEDFLNALIAIRAKINKYNVDILVIDNASTDNTQKILRNFANKNKYIKLIFNNRNFGHIRSPYWGIIQSYSDATIYLASDFQDPVELVLDFIKYWEDGYDVVLGVKNKTEEESLLIRFARKLFYKLITLLSDTPIVSNSTGFGLYDKKVLDNVRSINDPYPFLRGLIAELGFSVQRVLFTQPQRYRGSTKNNFFTLYDFALLGLINHSSTMLRVCSFTGLIISIFCILISLFYLFYKLTYWEEFSVGIAPLVIITSFFLGIILFFMGIIGEYIAAILRYVKNIPIVVEKERINFDL